MSELQKSDKKSRTIRVKGLERYEEIDEVLHYQRLSFILEVIGTKLISGHHNDLLADHFGIDKTRELIRRKYYGPSLKKDVESYIKDYNVCLALKAVRYKPHRDLQALLVPNHGWKDLLMDFVTGLPVSTDWKEETYDFILVIIDWLIKMILYKLLKVTIDAPGLTKVILNMVV